MMGLLSGLLKSLWVKKLGLIIPVAIVALVFWQGKAIYSMAIKYLPVKPVKTIKFDKSDPNWLKNYCVAEIKNLPAAPFRYTSLSDRVEPLGVPATHLKSFIPKDKWFTAKTCLLVYKYEPKSAYASVAVDYKFDIRASNTFQENVDRLISESIPKSWRKISPLSDEAGARPFYLYKGFPLVFTRDQADFGAVEFVSFTWGANELFVNLTVFEK